MNDAERKQAITDRLEYLRGEIRAESISYGEIAELESLADYIGQDDVELLEWAGVPEGCTHMPRHTDATECPDRPEFAGLTARHDFPDEKVEGDAPRLFRTRQRARTWIADKVAVPRDFRVVRIQFGERPVWAVTNVRGQSIRENGTLA